MPSVTITSPSSNATVSGTIEVHAVYSGSAFALATLTVDGAQAGSADTTVPIGFSWDTTTVANGIHTVGVSAKYRRESGLYRWTKAIISVTVKNGEPPPPPPPPLSVTIVGVPQSGNTLTAEAS